MGSRTEIGLGTLNLTRRSFMPFIIPDDIVATVAPLRSCSFAAVTRYSLPPFPLPPSYRIRPRKQSSSLDTGPAVPSPPFCSPPYCYLVLTNDCEILPQIWLHTTVHSQLQSACANSRGRARARGCRRPRQLLSFEKNRQCAFLPYVRKFANFLAPFRKDLSYFYRCCIRT